MYGGKHNIRLESDDIVIHLKSSVWHVMEMLLDQSLWCKKEVYGLF